MELNVKEIKYKIINLKGSLKDLDFEWKVIFLLKIKEFIEAIINDIIFAFDEENSNKDCKIV